MNRLHPKPFKAQEQTKNNQPYLFRMRGTAKSYIKEEILVQFGPVKAIDPNIDPHHLSIFSIIPTFNNDGKYYTLGFLNPFDEQDDEDDQLKHQHQTRVREYSTQIAENEILLPKPRHPDPFCCVCKVFYQDYLEHVSNTDHVKALKKSKYSKMIEELGITAQPIPKKTRRINKQY